MNTKILAFGASSSSTSINKILAAYAAKQVEGASVQLLDLNDFEMPIFSIDKEKQTGIPELAMKFKEEILSADGIVISFAEHNGAYSAAFKNIFDWISRIEGSVWGDKPMFLLATSPGGRGGQTVLEIAVNKFRFMNSSPIVHFSLPFFQKNFSEESGIQDEDLKVLFNEQLEAFKLNLS
jgi:NAD(P)H-dependent FMN reductase